VLATAGMDRTPPLLTPLNVSETAPAAPQRQAEVHYPAIGWDPYRGGAALYSERDQPPVMRQISGQSGTQNPPVGAVTAVGNGTPGTGQQGILPALHGGLQSMQQPMPSV